MNKLFANRMKKRRMSWTKKGANKMDRLISLRHSGKLVATKKISIRKPALTVASMSRTSERKEYEAKDSGTWLEANMPTLYVPHSDCPWVQMLRALTPGGTDLVAHASHPEFQPTNS